VLVCQAVAATEGLNRCAVESLNHQRLAHADRRTNVFSMPWTIHNLLLHDKPLPLSEQRALGYTKLFIYCSSPDCHCNAVIDASGFPNDITYSDLKPLFAFQFFFDAVDYSLGDVALISEDRMRCCNTFCCMSRRPLFLAFSGVVSQYSLMALSANRMPFISPLAIMRRKIPTQMSNGMARICAPKRKQAIRARNAVVPMPADLAPSVQAGAFRPNSV